MRTARLSWLVLVLAACTATEETSGTGAPTNDCPAHACTTYGQLEQTATCSPEGFCSVNSTLPYTLVVSLPDTATVAPSFTFAVPSDQFQTTSARCPIGRRCILIPRLGRSGGLYVAGKDAQLAVHRFLQNGSGDTSLPSHVYFRPLDPIPGSTSLASDTGLPLLPLEASYLSPELLPIDGAPRGPGGSAPVAWDVPLPFGRYQRTIVPDPPFSDAFPPQVDVVAITGRPFQIVPMGTIDDVAQRTFTIDSKGPSLADWTAEIDDSATRQRISSVATLHEGTNDVVLETVGRGVLQDLKVELVLRPPSRLAAIPMLVAPTEPTIGRKQTYPNLSPSVLVTGVVIGLPERTPVHARVFFRSKSDPGALSTDNVVLRYETDLDTDGQGRYALRLPPGTYDVAVVPDETTPYAMAISERVFGTDPIQQGKSLEVVRRASLSGTVRLTDGRALSGAEVEARPAAEPTTPLPFASLERVERATTDAVGAFSLRLDPGFYDVTVRPAEGTRFPWIVSASQRIDATDVLLPPMFVGVPIRAGLTLFDPTGSTPLRGALVRAYAVPEGKTVALEIGRAVTGEDGSYEMFFSPPSAPR